MRAKQREQLINLEMKNQDDEKSKKFINNETGNKINKYQ